MPIIEFSEVSKTYGRRHGERHPALVAVSFTLEAGELGLLMGPSGAGKSTLLKLLLAMERPDAGTISVAGRDIQRLSRASIPYLRRNVGAVFQDFKLLIEATPLENIVLALQATGLPRRQIRDRARQSLQQVDLDPELRKPVRCLSGGEQQRVGLARAIAGEPPILLADEPTGNLDPKLTRDILDVLSRISQSGTTVLLASHDPSVLADAGASRLLYLEAGRLEDRTRTLPRHRDDSLGEQRMGGADEGAMNGADEGELVGAVA